MKDDETGRAYNTHLEVNNSHTVAIEINNHGSVSFNWEV